MGNQQPKKSIKVSTLGVRQRALVAEKVSDPIVLINNVMKVIFANSAAIKFFGNTMVGGDLAKIWPDNEVIEKINSTLEDGTGRSAESSISKPVSRVFEVTMAAITPKEQNSRHGEQGVENLAVISFHDITTLKRAEKMRTDFVANAGHELKTPLTSLLGFIETLEGPAKGDRDALKTFLPIMHAEAERMINVIDDLMSLSKIEAQEHVAPDASVTLYDVCQNVAGTLDMAAKDRRISLKFHVSQDLPPICGETEQIFQALHNLISNAIKYGNRGSVVRILGKTVQTVGGAAKPGVAISVTDQGDGIPPKHQPRLTERFYRVDTARSKSIGGTGLGLAICQQLVELMGGQIGIESEEGQGSRAWFQIDVDIVDLPDEESPESDPILRDSRVLVVDDNATNRSILIHHLESWNASPSEAEDGRAALEAVRTAAACNEPFDLLILDMMMPGMTGLDVARAIRGDQNLPQPKMVILTSMGFSPDSEEETELDIAWRLSKPVRKGELRNALMGAMGNVTSKPGPRREATQPGAKIRQIDARILVVEDNAVNMEVTTAMLEAIGCRVVGVENGQFAVEKIAAERFDLVLMDCQMPIMDGFEATRAIRAREAQVAEGRLPIIALTAHAMASDRQECLTAGMDDYLTKPIKPTMVRSRVRGWLLRTTSP